MLSCRELVNETTGDPDLITPGHSFRWSVRLHLLMCHHCRRYVRQLRLLLVLLTGKQHRRQAAEAKTVDRIWQAIQGRRTAE
ncbi:MAG: zf-HC2 domain-containing protein [Gammaproteobacteria bacterium]|nr:zf-HC2 domain-containing protein [Gammaproteobacteria bacterium]